MSSPARVLAILELFTIEQPVWSLEAINAELGYSRTSGYRDLKELADLGYLQKVAKGFYALGPKIIQLDYQLNRAGSFKYGFRMYPKNEDLPHRQDFCFVRWI